MKITKDDIERMHLELVERGYCAPEDKYVLALHPLDKGKLETPTGAVVVLSRQVPLDHAYVVTEQQAREWFKDGTS